MKILLSILAAFSLTSCLPKIEPQERNIFSVEVLDCYCQMYDYMNLEPVEFQYIDEEGNTITTKDPILCDIFHQSKKEISLLSCMDYKFYDENRESCDYWIDYEVQDSLMYCDGLIGNRPEVWVTIRSWIFDLIETIRDSND